jgi:hypothetical protein
VVHSPVRKRETVVRKNMRTARVVDLSSPKRRVEMIMAMLVAPSVIQAAAKAPSFTLIVSKM